MQLNTINVFAAYNRNPINPIEMITTHPLLFNIIVALFIAFTSGWMVYVMVGRRSVNLKNRMAALEREKERLRRHAQQLEDQLQTSYPQNNTPVISLSSSVKINRTGDAGI